VFDDAQRARLVATSPPLLDGVTEPVLERAFEYWHKWTTSWATGVEKAVRGGQS